MTGWVDVMQPVEFEKWLSDNPTVVPMEVAGEALFQKLGCSACHTGAGSPLGPPLAGIYGSQVRLADGHVVVADESYIRESIVNPNAQIVAGYPSIMPTFKGQLSDQEMTQLIAYLRSLKKD